MTTLELLTYLRSLDVKLWMEQERLRYSAPAGALTPELLSRLAEHKEEILNFLREAGAAAPSTIHAILPARREKEIPLSFAQQRLWVFDRLNPNNAAYNLPLALRLKGSLNTTALKRTLEEIVQRHEVFRTRIAVKNGQPFQDISKDLKLQMPVVDLGGCAEPEREAEAQRLAADEARLPFDLSSSLPLRAILLKLDEEEHMLLLTMHHIASDGWSLGVLVKELATLYAAFSARQPSPLPDLPIQYADFSIWQRNWLQGGVLRSQLAYWKRQLGGDVPVLEMPFDRPRPPVQTFRGARETRLLPDSLRSAFKELCEREGVTLFMGLLAGLKVLLHRYTGQSDLLVGTIIANRNRAETESLIGFFANTLALRTDLSGDPTFSELLGRVRETSLGAYAHQDVPFEKLIEELQPQRDVSRTPFFQVMFVLQNAPMQRLELPGLSLGLAGVENGTAKFDLSLEVTELAEGFWLSLEYNTDLCEGSTIKRLLEQFQLLLEGSVNNPAVPISKLPLMTEQERRTLLLSWNHSGTPNEQRACLHELFEAQAKRTPDAVALKCEDEQLSYAELNLRANMLAHALRRRGVGPELLVGIYMQRGIELVIALLGVLKAGGAYVPLDPEYPQERLTFILDDARVPILLTQQSLIPNLSQHKAQVLCLDRDWQDIACESEYDPSTETAVENPAYVIYTSGSTGKPKGTLVSHYNVVRLFHATQAWFNFNESDVWTLFHSSAFDFSVWELWGALLYGGRLLIVPYMVSRSPATFRELLIRERVSVLNQTPSAFRQLIHHEETLGADDKLALRLIIFGGEALELQSLRPWFKRYGDRQPRLVNMYGITETTVHVTYRPLKFDDLSTPSSSLIGRAIPDLEIYLLDKHLEPVPVGVPGEIYVGGAGLARGYLRRPELTAERYIPHPFSALPGQRLYKSGDLGRSLSDGDIEYLGRSDLQVKIRGFRIELGEIESSLTQHSSVREALVVAREDGTEKRLVAYVVPGGGESLSAADLRSFLKGRLPEYMVPSAFIVLESLPLTAHGKVNYKSLPEPDRARPALEKIYVAPRTPTEHALAEIWAEVLGIERVGINDNFFELGGDSIRSIQVHVKAKQAGLNFSIQQLFRHSSISELVQEVSVTEAGSLPKIMTEPFSLIAEEDRSCLPADVEDAYPLTRLQAGMLFHSSYNPQSAVYHNITNLHLQAPFNRRKLHRAVQSLAARHPVLRTSFDLVSFSEPLQLVHREVSVPLEVDDLRHLAPTEQERVIDEWFTLEKQREFKWSHAPLLRFHVHLRSEQTFQLSWTEHHVILDGWSVASMMTELFQLYFSSFEERPTPLAPPPATTFREFVALERQAISSMQNRDFWLAKLSDSTSTVLPRWPVLDRLPETGQQSAPVPLPKEVSDDLKNLSRKAGVPIKSVLMAAHLRVLNVLSGQLEVSTGLILNGRMEEADGERVLGLFLNTIPLRLEMPGGTWLDLVRDVFKAELELMPFRRYPLAEIQRLVGGKPLFETTFNFINFHVYQNLKRFKDVQFLGTKVFADTNYALRAMFSIDLATSDLRLELGYLVSQFSAAQIEALTGYYARTLAAMAHQPAGNYQTCALLSQEERQRLLFEWNDTRADYPQEACVHQLFEAQVERTPDAVAVVFEERSLTYGELNARASQLARRLRSLGVGLETLVGLCVKRSLETAIGALGILKAGAAYVPLDPQHPLERLAFMLDDTRATVMVTQKELAAQFREQSALTLICLDEDCEATAEESVCNPVSPVAARNLAYVIYTSGTTGQPKGVLIEHRSLINYVQGITRRLQLAGGENFAMVQPLTVDASLTAFYPPLLSGGCVHIISQERGAAPHLMAEYLASHHIDCLKIAPSHLAALLSWEQPEKLMACRWLVMGGEALRREWVETLQAHAPECRILNHYGPTETTVAMLTHWFDPQDKGDGASSIPLGRPLQNSQVYLLDQHLEPVPVGAPGELYIGGDCLARGYLNQPQLTAGRFIPNPFSAEPNARLYRTGDIARYLPDGKLVFLGRADEQVKIRGYRVEPGEIASALIRHPVVQEGAVVASEEGGGEKQLVAYVVLKQGAVLDRDQLASFLMQKLPEYLVPSIFVQLDEIPRTLHGKLDRRALPVPPMQSPTALNESFAPPRDTLELELVRIWEAVLNVRPIGITHNFFKLGGNSISAVHLMARVHNRFKQDIPLVALFQQPTIEQIAVLLRQPTVNSSPSPLVEIQPAGSRRPLFFIHPVGGNVLSYFELARHLGPEQPFYGLQAAGLNGGQKSLTRIEDIAAYYIQAIRQRQPQGPYLLGGWSFGGVVAYEMSCQLQRQGAQVALLALVDSLAARPGRARQEEDADEAAALLVRFFADLCGLSGQEMPDFFDELRQLKGEEQLNYILEQASLRRLVPLQTDISHIHRLLQVFKSNRRALREYVPAGYRGRLILFRASDRDERVFPDPDLGWGEIAPHLEVQIVPGDHYRMMTSPHVQVLAERLSGYLHDVHKNM